jgi:hypothetical protein
VSPTSLAAVLKAVQGRLQAGWRRSPKIWTALAAAWVMILALNLTSREPGVALAAGVKVPSPEEIRLVLKQRQTLMSELALGPEAEPAEKPKPAPPGPQSARRSETVKV